MIGSVDEGDVDRCMAERFRGFDACEAAANDNDVRSRA
jgi:hypothetical protein